MTWFSLLEQKCNSCICSWTVWRTKQRHFLLLPILIRGTGAIMLELSRGKSTISLTFSSWLISHNGVTFQNPVFKISQCCRSSSQPGVIERQKRYLFERACAPFFFLKEILKEQPQRLIYDSNPNKEAQMNCQHFHILCVFLCLSAFHYSSVWTLSFGS